MSTTLLVVDGSSCFMRAWSVLPQEKQTGEALAYMVGRMFLKMLRRAHATHAVIALDAYPCWRTRLHPDYKGQRSHPSLNPAELTQIIGPWLREWGVPMLHQEGMEADDHLNSMAVKAKDGVSVFLCTRDSDLYAALARPEVKLLWPEAGAYHVITRQVAEDKLGFPPTWLPWIRALTADQKDNIRGLLNVEKGWRCPLTKPRAVLLLDTYGGDPWALMAAVEEGAVLEAKPRELDYLKEYREQIMVMASVASLREDADGGIDPKACDVRKFRIVIPEGS